MQYIIFAWKKQKNVANRISCEQVIDIYWLQNLQMIETFWCVSLDKEKVHWSVA